MILLDWYRQYRDIKESFREKRSICPTCESLKQQIEALRYDNKQLLDAVIAKETRVEAPVNPNNYQPIKPRYMPWGQRRQMLEAESREAARLLKQKTDEINTAKTEPAVAVVEETTIEELEQELDIAGQERETATGTTQ